MNEKKFKIQVVFLYTNWNELKFPVQIAFASLKIIIIFLFLTSLQ